METFATAILNSQEILYISLLIGITAVSLFALCGLSFMFGKKRVYHKSEFLKFFFLIPLWLCFLTFFTWLGQHITLRILPNAPLYPIASQLMSAWWGIIGIGFLTELRSFIPIPQSDFFFSYLLILLGILNIELFSALYLPLCLIMTTELALIYLSKYTRKTIFLIAYMILMIIPFIPGFLPIWPKNLPVLLSPVNFSPNLFSSFLISCLVLPFLLQLVRILISLGLWQRQSGSGQVLRNAVTGTLVRLLVCLMGMISIALYVVKNPVSVTDTMQITTGISNATVTARYTTTNEYGITRHTIEASADTEVTRYEISITFVQPPAILSSNLDFTAEDSVVHFVLENPDSNQVVIECITADPERGTVAIRALDTGFYLIPVEFVQ